MIWTESLIKFIDEISEQQYLDAIHGKSLQIPLDDRFRNWVKTALQTQNMEDDGIFLGVSYWQDDNMFIIYVTDNNDSYSITNLVTNNTKNTIISTFSKYLNIDIHEPKFY